MDEAKKLVSFIHYAEGLKKEMRNLELSDGRQESTADHSWRMALIIMVLAPKLEKKYNIEKALKMALIHDLVEIDAKDVPFYKHFQNEKAKKDKKAKEDIAIANINKMLHPDGQEIFDLWNEYEDQDTDEAKLVKAMDKLESRMQFIEGDQIDKPKDSDPVKIKQAGEYFEKLIGIDPLLVQMAEITRVERDKKYEENGPATL